MTSLTIQLPDELAEKAKRIGLLESKKLTELFEQAIQNSNPVVTRRKPDPRLANLMILHDDLIEPVSDPDDWECD